MDYCKMEIIFGYMKEMIIVGLLIVSYFGYGVCIDLFIDL
ncbi:hypothetical protein GCM10010495_82570 [Kitasatospora herbaricolor]|nr:hypothetical protein GCM10010495_82570 [Kitasatospora herbaricolor]